MPDTRTPADKTLSAQIAANTRWGNTTDRSAATSAARRGLRAKFETQVDPDGTMHPAERERRVESLMKAHMQRMTLAAKRARQRKSGATRTVNS
ncbi:MAG: hypothetical protein Q7T56_08745 [Nocardioidaceae bacterium]|nr:hypothetical protein [Nocardioidaceae bacterium]